MARARWDILKGNIVCFNTRKHTNEGIYDNVEVLEEAIQGKKQASFLYFDKCERVYRKEKNRYVVEPMTLIFNKDNYYLMCFSSKYDGITNYRVNRMEDVSVEDIPYSEGAIMDDSDIAKYIEQAFKMYGGSIFDATLEFEDKLIGVVQDKFGEHMNINQIGSDKFLASLQLQVSPTFWGWLFQFGKQTRILSPEWLVDEYRSKIGEIAD